MKDKRQFRKKGEILQLGGFSCRIQSVEGCGGSAVVYRAVYQDAVSSGGMHHVLLKELFPWTADGSVYRDADGCIRCTDAGQALFARSAEGFLDGNAANLTLLERMPEQVSGNLNSYEAYGTYYTLLPVHGGENLFQLLEEEGRAFTLREIVQITTRILDALECFHGCGLLHLDISPDNVLLLQSCAMLIDYNSVWCMDGDTESFRFSKKEGYTPPEVRLQEIDAIGPASDLYSVTAVLYRMLTGRILTEEEMNGLRPIGDLTKDLPVFAREPASAVSLVIRIVRRGLHLLSKKRYPDTRAMKRDLTEVLLRLDRKGITYASLWEGSRLDCIRQRGGQKESYLPRSVRKGEAGDPDRGSGAVRSGDCSEQDILRELAGGGCLLLTGIGGMGKTCLLRQLWETGTRKFSERAPAVFYVPLAGYRAAGQDGQYIRRYLLRQLNLSEQGSMDAALQELNRLLDPASSADREKGTRHSWIFLLDGLNEAGPHAEKLLREIEELAAMEDTGILLTDRTAGVLKYALKGFRDAQLLPLTQETVRDALAARGLKPPEDAQLFASLSNPMMLSLYCRILLMDPAADESAQGPDPAACESMQGMIDCYMDALCTTEMRRDSGSPKDQLRHTYILRHLLPAIALQAQKQEGHGLSRAELTALTEADYNLLRSRTFSAAFPEYTGKSRLILDGIEDGREWFDYAVSGELTERFGLLKRSGSDIWSFAHENFMECLAVHGQKRQDVLQRIRRRRLLKRAVPAAVCAAAVVIVLVFLLVKVLPHDLTESEQEMCEDTAVWLDTNAFVINYQLNTALDLLDDIGDYTDDNDDPDPDQIAAALSSALLATEDYVDSYYVETDAYITDLEDAFAADIPSQTMREMLNAPKELQALLKEQFLLLADQAYAAGPDEIGETADELTAYLEAYTVWYYLDFNEVLLAFNELGADEAVDEMTYYMNDSGTAFTDCKTYYSLGTMTEEALADAQQTAEDALSRAAVNLP